MTGLNNKNTSKVYIHDQEMAEGESDGTSISTIPAKGGTVGKEGKGEDKRRGVPTGRWI